MSTETRQFKEALSNLLIALISSALVVTAGSQELVSLYIHEMSFPTQAFLNICGAVLILAVWIRPAWERLGKLTLFIWGFVLLTLAGAAWQNGVANAIVLPAGFSGTFILFLWYAGVFAFPNARSFEKKLSIGACIATGAITAALSLLL